MSGHLSRAAIESYVARRGEVDEILAAAEHLDVCFDCRDVAAALVDDGTGERPHRASGGNKFVRSVKSRTLGPWLFGLLLVAMAAALMLLLQK